MVTPAFDAVINELAARASARARECDACGFNAPHHSLRCPHAAPLIWRCVGHRPMGMTCATDDGPRATCDVCGARKSAKGYQR
jgi:predicted RNA-binding Zn-ribbon protein involved in translation (DUF1610 family)